MEVGKKYSLPMQALIGVMLLAEAFMLFILLYLRKNFHFDFSDAKNLFGWIMLISTIILSVWNVILLIGRKRRLNKNMEEDVRKQIFQSSTYGRYFTLIGIALIGIALTFVRGNMYFLVFVALSFIWQIAIFPSRSTIYDVLNDGLTQEAKVETSETPVNQSDETNQPGPIKTDNADL